MRRCRTNPWPPALASSARSGSAESSWQSITTMAPGASVVFGLGLIMVYTGIAAPFSMLIGAIGAVLVAYCIGQLATRIPSAGGFYSYAAITFGNSFGFIVGWLYSALYVILVCVSGINFSLVTQDFLNYYFHIAPPYWLLVAIIVLALLGVTYIGVRVSTGVTAILGIIEVGNHPAAHDHPHRAGRQRQLPHALQPGARRPARARPPSAPSSSASCSPSPPPPDSRPACRWPRRPRTPSATCRWRWSCPPG